MLLQTAVSKISKSNSSHWDSDILYFQLSRFLSPTRATGPIWQDLQSFAFSLPIIHTHFYLFHELRLMRGTSLSEHLGPLLYSFASFLYSRPFPFVSPKSIVYTPKSAACQRSILPAPTTGTQVLLEKSR